MSHRTVVRLFVVGIVASMGLAAHARTDRHDHVPPSAAQIATAQKVSDLMLNELLAALFQEFGETTADNVDEGEQAISLIFDDANRSMRLVGAFAPLLGGANDRPADGFERRALDDALAGNAITAVERVDGAWLYRRSIPLSNTFHKNCVLCHEGFTADFFERTDNPGQWVGALVLGVPIRGGREH
jgi:hypothetical protein